MFYVVLSVVLSVVLLQNLQNRSDFRYLTNEHKKSPFK